MNWIEETTVPVWGALLAVAVLAGLRFLADWRRAVVESRRPRPLAWGGVIHPRVTRCPGGIRVRAHNPAAAAEVIAANRGLAPRAIHRETAA